MTFCEFPSGRVPWNFDARGFGQQLRKRRRSLGYSTREVARRAGVSQSYVVALEGSRSSRDVTGPSPTIDVLAGLASALEIEPWALLEPALRRAGPHVLLVVEDDGEGLFDAARSAIRDVDLWVSAGRRRDPDHPRPHLSLCSGTGDRYDRDQVAAGLQADLAALNPLVDGRRLGLVFSEREEVLLAATEDVLEIEQVWSAMVGRAVWSAGAHPAWTLCVYELDVLQRMGDPVAASLDLMSSHDRVWTTKRRTVHRGRTACTRVLRPMRPPGTRADHWREVCARHIDRLAAAH
jgi:transcriptional regulator with XRE-family HTH domain